MEQRRQRGRAITEGKLWRHEPLEDRYTIPALRDLHTHPFIYSLMRKANAIDISGCKTPEELRKKLEPMKGRGIIFADGLDTNSLSRLTAKDLDAISKDDMIFIADPSYHGGVVNSKAARALKEKAQGRDIRGELKEDGAWDEEYLKLCLEAMAENMDRDALVDEVTAWLEEQQARGIVEIHDPDCASVLGLETLVSAKERWGDGFPVTKVYATLDVLEQVSLELAGKLCSHFGGVGLKIYMDGSFGSYTAALSAPYNDSSARGKLLRPASEAQGIMERIREHSLRLFMTDVAMHAIGDRAIMHALEIARQMHMGMELQGWIQHYELSGDVDVLETTRALVGKGAVGGVVMNPNFVSDCTVYEGRLGKRIEMVNPLAAILDLGIPMRIGTDGMPQDMFRALYDAMNHPIEMHRLELEDALGVATGVQRLEDAKRTITIKGPLAESIFLRKGYNPEGDVSLS